jgi:hypothetical protein
MICHSGWMNITSFATLDLLHVSFIHDVELMAEICSWGSSKQLRTRRVGVEVDLFAPLKRLRGKLGQEVHSMVKSGSICFVVMVTVLTALAAQNQRVAEKNNRVVLKYLGTAGWEITDGTSTILIDPYLSIINGPPPPGSHSMPGDTRRAYGWGDLATPDVAAIDSHIQRADFVLVTHTHYGHVLDVPHIALKTGALLLHRRRHLRLHLRRNLGEQKRNLQPHVPRRAGYRMDGISVKHCRDIQWLKSELHDAARAPPTGHRPHIPRRSLPIRINYWRRRQVPAPLQVVVDEVLQHHLVHILAAPGPGDRPHIIGQHANRPMTPLCQGHNRGSNAELSLSQHRARSRGQRECRAYSQDQLVRLRRCNEESRNHVPKTGHPRVVLHRLCPKVSRRVLFNPVQLQVRRSRGRLEDNRHDPANDHVPVLADLKRYHRLNVQHILRAIEWLNPEVVIVLYRNTDQTRHGILRRLRQIGCSAIVRCGFRRGLLCLATDGIASQPGQQNRENYRSPSPVS